MAWNEFCIYMIFLLLVKSTMAIVLLRKKNFFYIYLQNQIKTTSSKSLWMRCSYASIKVHCSKTFDMWMDWCTSIWPIPNYILCLYLSVPSNYHLHVGHRCPSYIWKVISTSKYVILNGQQRFSLVSCAKMACLKPLPPQKLETASKNELLVLDIISQAMSHLHRQRHQQSYLQKKTQRTC